MYNKVQVVKPVNVAAKEWLGKACASKLPNRVHLFF